jgi:hypothetical protein
MSYYDSGNIIVGAANVWVGDIDADVPKPVSGYSYADTLNAATTTWRNIGYTSNGLELQFAPEFGEVQVDQMLDVAKMFKSGMTVTLNTSMAEATLENLLFAIAGDESNHTADGTNAVIGEGNGTDKWGAGTEILDLSAGALGECPVERKLIAVGPGGGDCDADMAIERIYVAYRVLSIDSVSLAAKRDEATTFDVSFRLMAKSIGTKNLYGQIVDRTFAHTS